MKLNLRRALFVAVRARIQAEASANQAPIILTQREERQAPALDFRPARDGMAVRDQPQARDAAVVPGEVVVSLRLPPRR